MTIGIVGLGLIGGSLAKTTQRRTDHRLLGFDQDSTVLDRALRERVLHGILTPADFRDCELILLALFPAATLQWLTENGPRLSANTVVVDCAGVKEQICQLGQQLSARHGFSFVGGHPMAGTEQMGYAASREGLFDGATMILVPGEPYPDWVRTRVEGLLRQLGFGGANYSTATEHDRTIAYTSQLAHLVSSAYIKSPTAQRYLGFSAGSFKDMTRVAFLNEPMWTELFLENRQGLLAELRELQKHLVAYEQALVQGDAGVLESLLKEGRIQKLLSDNRGVQP